MDTYKSLTSIRSKYPATTSAVHTMMMRASELHRSREKPSWVDLNGINLSQIGFERSVKHVLSCARKETGKEKPTDLLKFLNGFLTVFAMASYGFKDAYQELRKRELTADEIPAMLEVTHHGDPTQFVPAI